MSVERQAAPSKVDDGALLALAAFYQSQLGIIVTTAELYPGGMHYGVSTLPSSLVTSEPFTPGGLRRLVLNVHAPLIQEAAALFAETCSRSTSKEKREEQRKALRRLGSAMIRSGSWPVAKLDVPFVMHWKMARGLVATPHCLYTWPAPHEPAAQKQLKENMAPGTQTSCHEQLIIWPKRICHVDIARTRTFRSGVDEDDAPIACSYTLYAREVWARRDEGLQLDFHNVLRQLKPHTFSNNSSDVSSSSIWKTAMKLMPHIPTNNVREMPSTSPSSTDALFEKMKLVTIAPSFPVLCVADYLQSHYPQAVPCHMAMTMAAKLLVEHDRLFALSLFFGVPLVDRTQTLFGSCRTTCIVPAPPSRDDVAQWRQQQQQQQQQDPVVTESYAVFRKVLLQRAQAIWDQQEPKSTIYIAWSGGIDSTALLCAFLTVRRQGKHGDVSGPDLAVILDEASMDENPDFYEHYLQDNKDGITLVPRQDQPLSWHAVQICSASGGKHILVTGELGDQIFGSDRCRAAFDRYDTKEQEYQAHLQVFQTKGLEAPWEEVILPSLVDAGLAKYEDIQSWRTWMAPQLAKAPFPIKSTYDWLWWVNFSMKWQNVSVRLWHDGGNAVLPTMMDPTPPNSVVSSHVVVHFYQDRDIECWSCVQDFHSTKFPDLARWNTYKEPMKRFIHEFDNNDEYYREKCKVGSLCFSIPSEADSPVNRFFGAFLVEDSAKNGKTDIPRILTWGVCGMIMNEDAREGQLGKLLRNDFTSKLESSIGVEEVIVDPWNNDSRGEGPFDTAPEFCEHDIRQRRSFNPVSKITLIGKCSALLTPELLGGRTFLDLGSCMGASSHWALCMGAKHVTAVEVQETFCRESHQILKNHHNDDKFQVICSGAREFLQSAKDQSYDNILAAGILHCFMDPITILLEMVRVASHSILIETTHSDTYENASLLDPDNSDSLFTQSELRRAVLPSVTTSGLLLQVAPQALVNMADEEASFRGVSVIASRLALESLMKSLGFEVTRVRLQGHPTANEDVAIYTAPKRHRSLPGRFFLRCVRRRGSGTNPDSNSIRTSKPHSLEELVTRNDYSQKTAWDK